MKNKYYTPNLEEFHIGFEYEFLEQHGSPDEQWVKKILTRISDGENDMYLGDTFVAIENYDIVYLRNAWRVKYLDIEDLESLGWECLTKSKTKFNICTFQFKKYRIDVSFDTHSIEIYEYNAFSSIKYIQIFKGYVKNKSEFKQLMKFLNI